MTTLTTVAAWLKTHPVRRARGMGSVQEAFTGSAGAVPEKPKLEFLLRNPATREWYVRWPNGSIRWEAEAGLHGRGFKTPRAPIIGEIEELV